MGSVSLDVTTLIPNLVNYRISCPSNYFTGILLFGEQRGLISRTAARNRADEQCYEIHCYPSNIVNLLSTTLLDQCAFFLGASSQGGLYKCELSAKTVTQAVGNSTLPCSEVNQVCTLSGKVVYTDTKAGKVMQYNPDDNSVRALVGSGHNGYSDGTQDSCSFKQIEGISSVDKTLFVTYMYVSAGKLKIVTSLSETISFLGILGSLYDTFGIHSKGMKPDGVSLKQAKKT